MSGRSRGPIACAAATFLNDRYFTDVLQTVLFGCSPVVEYAKWIDGLIEL